jgi:hypothetical protein
MHLSEEQLEGCMQIAGREVKPDIESIIQANAVIWACIPYD